MLLPHKYHGSNYHAKEKTARQPCRKENNYRYDEFTNFKISGIDYKIVMSVSQCAQYDIFIQKNEQILIEAAGIIESLKMEFIPMDYSKATSLLNSINAL